MITVIARIYLNADCREKFLKIFKENIPNVREEAGCISYTPYVDADVAIGLPIVSNPDLVTVIEEWESIEILKAHLEAPHMVKYREMVKELVNHTELSIFAEA